MSTRFVACPACSHHVREDDAVCPFCGAAFPTPAPRRLLRGRLSRAALGAAGAVGVSVVLPDCSHNVSGSSFYGAPSQEYVTTCEIRDCGTDVVDEAIGLFCNDGSCTPQLDAGSEAGPSSDAQTDGAGLSDGGDGASD